MPPCAATIAAAQDDVAALSALLEQERAEADAADAVPGGSSLLEVDAAVGATPLHIAARRGHCAAVTWLLEHKASLTATDRDGATPLAMAVASEDIPTAAAVLAAVKSWDEGSSAVDAADTEGMTPLHDAAGLPHAALVKLLLGAQANPNAASANGVTPLVMCAAAERQMGSGAARCCSALLAAGADPAVAVGGQTPLVLALRARSWAAAGVLGAAAAAPDGGANNVDSVVLAGRTPLHNAAFIGDAEAVSYLLEKGAQPGLQDDAGRTALHAAASYGSAPTVMALLTAAAAGRKKLASVPDSAGGTALHDAALGGHVAVIQLLLTEENGGAELAGVEDKRGQTAEALARTMAASEDPAAAAALAALTGTAPAGVAGGGGDTADGQRLGRGMLRNVLVEERTFLQGKLRALRLQQQQQQQHQHEHPGAEQAEQAEPEPAPSAASVNSAPAPAAGPTPAQIAGFLTKLTRRLTPLIGAVSPALRSQLGAGMATLGWDDKANRPAVGVKAAPSIEAVLEQLQTWEQAVAAEADKEGCKAAGAAAGAEEGEDEAEMAAEMMAAAMAEPEPE